MDWSSIIYVASASGIAGGLGALLGNLLAKGGKFKNAHAVIGGALIIPAAITASALYKNMSLPRIFPMDVSELIDEVPMYGVIKQQDPTAFKKLLYPIDKMVRNGSRDDAGVTEFRAELDKIITEKRSMASADTIRNEYEISTELFSKLKEKAPKVCTQKFYGRPYQWLDEVLDENYAERERQAMAAYFTNPPRSDAYILDAKRGEELFNQYVQSIVQELSVTDFDPPLTDDPTTIENHKKICDLQSKLNSAVIALPDNDLLHVAGYIASVE